MRRARLLLLLAARLTLYGFAIAVAVRVAGGDTDRGGRHLVRRPYRIAPAAVDSTATANQPVTRPRADSGADSNAASGAESTRRASHRTPRAPWYRAQQPARRGFDWTRWVLLPILGLGVVLEILSGARRWPR